jgi:hypothetical protein
MNHGESTSLETLLVRPESRSLSRVWDGVDPRCRAARGPRDYEAPDRALGWPHLAALRL